MAIFIVHFSKSENETIKMFVFSIRRMLCHFPENVHPFYHYQKGPFPVLFLDKNIDRKE